MEKVKFLTIKQLQSKIQHISIMSGNHRYAKINFYYDDGTASPFINVTEEGYHWLVTDRGKVIESKKTTDSNELLYWVASYFTSIAAFDYEFRWRKIKNFFRNIIYKNVPPYDCRRIAFKKQLELLRKIDPVYETRQRAELQEILKQNPFTDGLPNADTI
jgi:hypothetical protein